MKPHYCDTGYCQDKTFSVSEDLSTVCRSVDDGDWDNCMMVVPAMAPGTGQHTISMKLDCKGQQYMSCGVVREGALWNVDHAHFYSTMGWFIHAEDGGLFGNGKDDDDQAGDVLPGQVVTMQVDLDKGTLKFWVDGKQHGPGYTDGVTGPVQWAVSVFGQGDSVQIVPTPELEPWQ